MATPEQKTEAATPRRRQEARRQGMTLQAPGVSRSLSVAGLLLIALAVTGSGASIYGMLREHLASPPVTPVPGVAWATGVMQQVILGTFETALPFLLIGLVIALLGPILQHGVAVQPMRFDLSRIDPTKGFQRMFSQRSLLETVISLGALIVMLPVAALIWWNLVHQIFQGLYPLQALLTVAFGGARTIGYALVGIAAAAAAADYLIARGQFERDIRMTRQEMREEMRRSEGDPLVRARLRSLQRRAARMRMLARVKEADVVIVNPTHYAVALKYDAKAMQAPEVVAKGRGFIAERIKEEATAQGVPIVPNESLAQALHRSVEVGHPIPPALFRAVAEVLAYVYRQQGKVPGGGSA